MQKSKISTLIIDMNKTYCYNTYKQLIQKYARALKKEYKKAVLAKNIKEIE